MVSLLYKGNGERGHLVSSHNGRIASSLQKGRKQPVSSCHRKKDFLCFYLGDPLQRVFSLEKRREGSQYPFFNDENCFLCLETEEAARFLLPQEDGLPPLVKKESRLPLPLEKEKNGVLPLESKRASRLSSMKEGYVFFRKQGSIPLFRKKGRTESHFFNEARMPF